MANLYAGINLPKEWVYMASRLIMAYIRNDLPSPIPSSTSSSTAMITFSAFICQLIFHDTKNTRLSKSTIFTIYAMIGSRVRDDRYLRFAEKRMLLRQRDVIGAARGRSQTPKTPPWKIGTQSGGLGTPSFHIH